MYPQQRSPRLLQKKESLSVLAVKYFSGSAVSIITGSKVLGNSLEASTLVGPMEQIGLFSLSCKVKLPSYD